MTIRLLTFVMIGLLLSGCGDKMHELKEAVSGIDTAANKAANALTLDAHTIRGLEIEHNNKVFTLNDLFKAILRDVQWEYDEIHNLHIFKVKGTWKDPLFDEYQLTQSVKKQLAENGKVIITFEMKDHEIIADSTKIQMLLEDEIIVEESGEMALHYLYDFYTASLN